MMRKTADIYTKLAKQQGYPARSVFKLQQINKQHRILKRGQMVLDLGFVPGSWTMFAAKSVGSEGSVLAVDINKPPANSAFPSNVTTAQMDVMKWNVSPSLRKTFDVILSDMAPSTTGVKSFDATASYELCGRALDIADRLLKDKGAVLVKAFHGAEFERLRQRMMTSFRSVHVIKPLSSRSESVEVFVLGRGRRKQQKQEQANEKDAISEKTGKTTSAAPEGTESETETEATSSDSELSTTDAETDTPVQSKQSGKSTAARSRSASPNSKTKQQPAATTQHTLAPTAASTVRDYRSGIKAAVPADHTAHAKLSRELATSLRVRGVAEKVAKSNMDWVAIVHGKHNRKRPLHERYTRKRRR